MKLSCLPVSIYDDLTTGRKTLFDWLDFAAELGLDGADMSVAHLNGLSATERQQLRHHADSVGLEIAMIVTYTDFTHPEATERQRQIDELRSHIDLAYQLGSSFLRVTAGQAHPGISRTDGVQRAIAGLQACLAEAQQAHITLAYENHTIGYGWHYTDFSQPADIFSEIVAGTAGGGLKLLFDTANNLVLNDDPVAVLTQVKDRVAILHVSDIKQAGNFEPVVIGTGASPISDLFQIMHGLKYDSWLSIEEASKTGELGFKEAITYTRNLWQTTRTA